MWAERRARVGKPAAVAMVSSGRQAAEILWKLGGGIICQVGEGALVDALLSRPATGRPPLPSGPSLTK